MPELDRHGVVAAVVLVALGLAPLAAWLTGETYLISIFTRIAIYALAAMSLDFILGYGGMVSFGHAAFLGIGAYVAGVLSLHAYEATPLLLGLPGSNQALVVWPLAFLVAGAFAAVIGLVSLRTRGVYFIMITLAFAQMIYFFFVSLEPYGGDDGLSLWWGRNRLGPLELDGRLTFFYVVFAILVAALIVFRRLIHSRFGRVLRGCRQNERRMRALGYEPLPYRLAAFCIAGGVCGLAGALLANQTEFVSPALMHWSRSGQLMVMVILGGMGSLGGAVLGAGTLLLMEEVLISYTEHWQVILGPFLILVVLFARRGLVGLVVGSGRGG